MSKIPVWLFFALYLGAEPKGKWADEKEKLALTIMESLKQRALDYYWDPTIIKKVLEVNPHDNNVMYGGQEPKTK